VKKNIAFMTISLLTILTSCTDPYAFQNDSFEDVLVIEATVTNELKKQEIKVTRTFQLEEKDPIFEKNATVFITDDLGNQFNFEEQNGKYISQNEFQAIPIRQYQLFVNTSNGKEYQSTIEELPSISNQVELNASATNLFGVDGVEITANSFDPTNSSKYYRFEYEETYKIVSPYWTSDSLNLSYNPTNFIVSTWITQKSYNSKVCYNTEYSNEILLANTTAISEDKITDFPVRFIPQNNSIIAHRYSILVKQYVQNLEAHTFYSKLKELSNTNTNILSPKQQGFVEGNMNNRTDNSEKVIGFFDVSSVSKKRIFFNYNDFFEGESENNYPFKCIPKGYSEYLEVVDCNRNPPYKDIPPYCEYGKYALYLELVTYKSGIYAGYDGDTASFLTTFPICGECNRLWSTEVPSFWQ
tara:strand:+ start:88528 stop:89766 length:1239 start_codon:yes stop_codon:yes gene_type:complete